MKCYTVFILAPNTVFPDIIAHIKVTLKYTALNIKTIKHCMSGLKCFKNTSTFEGANVLIYVSRAPQGFFCLVSCVRKLMVSKVVEKPLKQARVYYSLPLQKGTEIYNT